MKNKKYFIALTLILSLLSCQNKSHSYEESFTQTPENILLPTPKSTPPNKSLSLIQGIFLSVEKYNLFIENEKNTGTFEPIVLPDGKESFVFTGESLSKVYQVELQLTIEIENFNQQYYSLVINSNFTTLTPVASKDLENLLEEFSIWSENEVLHGSIVEVYSTSDGSHYSILIGDSYVKMKQWEFQIATVRANLSNLSQESMGIDIFEIQRIENGSLPVFMDIGAFPYYRSDVNLSTYETALNFYILNSQTHKVIEISPKQLPTAIEGNPQELEQKAKELIALISPEVNIELLTPTHGEKIGTYFFRWEDRTKPFLDDGRSYPFIQVGFNGNGEILGFYNTLSLSR
jgi:hypothetical protein